VAARFNPQVESMEGAAFMCACQIGRVSFAQVRAVSNIVEPRNRGAWRMADAIRSLGRAGLAILDRA
jgi:nucleoside phosphorylase